MRQHKSNQHGLILIVNFGDEPVLVPADVEDRAFPIRISVRELPPRFSQVPPGGSFGDAIPAIQRFLGVRVLLPELSQSLSADNMQGEPLSGSMLPKR
jgi:hypothetical protein